MKLIGLLIVGFCVGFYGFINTAKLLSSQKQLMNIIKLINRIKELISYQSMTLGNILVREREDENFSFLLSENDFETPKEYFEKICFENNSLSISNEEKKLLFDYFEGLGKTDVSGQINHCNLYIKAFEQALKEKRINDLSKIKLYPSLGVLGGLMVVVVFI